MPTIPGSKKMEISPPAAYEAGIVERVFYAKKPRNPVVNAASNLRVGEALRITCDDWNNPKKIQAIRQACQRIKAKKGWSFKVASDEETGSIWVMRAK